jgi:hypothetical protein
VLLAADGTLYIAWFSDRGNDNDIYISRSTDETTWSAPVRVSKTSSADFYPNLIQDQDGTLHLVWFQCVDLFLGQIRHASSADGTRWSVEVAVTTELLTDDWLPSLVVAPDGGLLAYFVSRKRISGNSTNEIYVARHPPGGTTWEPARRLTAVNSSMDHDVLPYAARIGSNVGLVWVRHDARNADFITHPKSDLFYATSSDGLTFSTPTQVTRESGNAANLFPQLVGATMAAGPGSGSRPGPARRASMSSTSAGQTSTRRRSSKTRCCRQATRIA